MSRGGLDLNLDGTEFVELSGPSGQTTTQAIADLSEVSATPGAVRVLGPFAFTFDTPNLDSYAPIGPFLEVGDVILDGWIDVIEAWDGTNPLCNVGPSSWTGSPNLHACNIYLDVACQSVGGLFASGNNLPPFSQPNGGSPSRAVPALVTESGQCRIGVGEDTPSTQGLANLYLLIATPSLT